MITILLIKNCGGYMNIKATILGIILGSMVLPASAITWNDAKDALVSTAKNTFATIQAKPAYAVAGALALGAASWHLYNTYQRTHYVGDQKFFAPSGALVRNRAHDTNRFAHTRMYYFSLPREQFSKIVLARGQKPSNILQAFHDSYDHNSGMRMIIHCDMPYHEQPIVGIRSQSKDLVIALPQAHSVGRVDYIFMRPKYVRENVN